MQLSAASHHFVTEEVCVLQHMLKQFGLDSIFCIHLHDPSESSGCQLSPLGPSCRSCPGWQTLPTLIPQVDIEPTVFHYVPASGIGPEWTPLCLPAKPYGSQPWL